MTKTEAYKNALDELAYRREKDPKNYRGDSNFVYDSIDKPTKKEYIQYLLQSARQRANANGLEFDLVYEDLLPLPKHCRYLNYPLEYFINRLTKRKSNTASLDRIDNSFGYVPGNVQIISWKANNLKRQKTEQDFVAFIDMLRSKKVVY